MLLQLLFNFIFKAKNENGCWCYDRLIPTVNPVFRRKPSGSNFKLNGIVSPFHGKLSCQTDASRHIPILRYILPFAFQECYPTSSRRLCPFLSSEQHHFFLYCKPGAIRKLGWPHNHCSPRGVTGWTPLGRCLEVAPTCRFPDLTFKDSASCSSCCVFPLTHCP